MASSSLYLDFGVAAFTNYTAVWAELIFYVGLDFLLILELSLAVEWTETVLGFFGDCSFSFGNDREALIHIG